jgi:hypothetical protein
MVALDPSPTRFDDVDDTADHTPVVYPGYAPHFVRKKRPKPLELPLTQPELAQIEASAIAQPESHSDQ